MFYTSFFVRKASSSCLPSSLTISQIAFADTNTKLSNDRLARVRGYTAHKSTSRVKLESAEEGSSSALYVGDPIAFFGDITLTTFVGATKLYGKCLAIGVICPFLEHSQFLGKKLCSVSEKQLQSSDVTVHFKVCELRHVPTPYNPSLPKNEQKEIWRGLVQSGKGKITGSVRGNHLSVLNPTVTRLSEEDSRLAFEFEEADLDLVVLRRRELDGDCALPKMNVTGKVLPYLRGGEHSFMIEPMSRQNGSMSEGMSKCTRCSLAIPLGLLRQHIGM